MRKIIIKVIDHNGSEIEKTFTSDDTGIFVDLDIEEKVIGILETMDTDFDTKNIKVGGGKALDIKEDF